MQKKIKLKRHFIKKKLYKKKTNIKKIRQCMKDNKYKNKQ